MKKKHSKIIILKDLFLKQKNFHAIDNIFSH